MVTLHSLIHRRDVIILYHKTNTNNFMLRSYFVTDANAADLAEHVEQQPTSADVDYSLIGPPEELPPGAVPSLSAYEIAKGYTILGSPAHGAGPLPQCPLDPGSSTYSEVRSEGESFHQPQTAFDDYSRLGFASAAEDGITVPSAGK